MKITRYERLKIDHFEYLYLLLTLIVMLCEFQRVDVGNIYPQKKRLTKDLKQKLKPMFD